MASTAESAQIVTLLAPGSPERESYYILALNKRTDWNGSWEAVGGSLCLYHGRFLILTKMPAKVPTNPPVSIPNIAFGCWARLIHHKSQLYD